MFRLDNHTGRSVFGYSLKISLLIWIGGKLLSAPFYLTSVPDSPPVLTWWMMLAYILVAPILETQVLRLVLWLLRLKLKDEFVMCLVCAGICALLHVNSGDYGVYAAWGFFWMGRGYLQLEPVGHCKAAWVVTAIHATCNAMSLLAALAFTYLLK